MITFTIDKPQIEKWKNNIHKILEIIPINRETIEWAITRFKLTNNTEWKSAVKNKEVKKDGSIKYVKSG